MAFLRHCICHFLSRASKSHSSCKFAKIKMLWKIFGVRSIKLGSLKLILILKEQEETKQINRVMVVQSHLYRVWFIKIYHLWKSECNPARSVVWPVDAQQIQTQGTANSAHDTRILEETLLSNSLKGKNVRNWSFGESTFYL